MKLPIIFKDEVEARMKKQFGPFTNPRQVYGVKAWADMPKYKGGDSDA